MPQTQGLDEARALLAAVDGLWRSDPAAALVAIEAAWPDIDARPHCIEDAETCRQARVAASRLERWNDVTTWRVRALARCVSTGWQTGAASILMADLFQVLARDNAGYVAGQTLDVLQPSSAAEAIVHELRPFTVASADADQTQIGPDATIIARFYMEKSGLLLLLRREYARAAERFEAALAAPIDDRGELKVTGGLLLAQYLQALDGGEETAEFADRTEQLVARAEATDSDVRDCADHNAREMRGLGRALRVYDIL